MADVEKPVETPAVAAKPVKLRETVHTDVYDCPRCGMNHTHLKFAILKRSHGGHTHWAMCSRTSEPILMAILPPEA